MAMVEHVAAVIPPGQQQAALHLLKRPEESNATTRRHFANPTRDILSEHGPSLGKTPDPIGEFEPVILTSSRTSQRDGLLTELYRLAPALT
jgi:hypothetical protein